MKTYLIGYDLDRPHQDYPDLIQAIEKYATHWHCLDSTWLVKTNESAVAIRDKLKAHIDDDDKLLVASLTGESAWTGFTGDCKTWLSNHIKPT